MPRGGKRQGTPGVGYSNRTDLQASPNMAVNTAATGGMTAPAPEAPPQPDPSAPTDPQMAPRSPDDSPMLTDPTHRPDEPITAGLSLGAGPGPVDPRVEETKTLKKWLPLLGMYIDNPDTPDSVRAIFRYIKAS